MGNALSRTCLTLLVVAADASVVEQPSLSCVAPPGGDGSCDTQESGDRALLQSFMSKEKQATKLTEVTEPATFATMPFAGPVSVYGTNGWYKWGGKATCGISKVSNSTACNFTLHPQGPALDRTTSTGLAGGQELPTPGQCSKAEESDGKPKFKGKKESNGGWLLEEPAMAQLQPIPTVTFAANPEQYGTNGYWRVNLKKSQNEDGTPGPMKPDCDEAGTCQFTMYPKGPAANPVTKTGTEADAPLPDYSSCT